MNVIYTIMVIATMQTSDPIQSHYQLVKFDSIESCAVYLGENKMKLTHELIHLLEKINNNKLLDLNFKCTIDKGIET